jgi:hypothetical protein
MIVSPFSNMFVVPLSDYVVDIQYLYTLCIMFMMEAKSQLDQHVGELTEWTCLGDDATIVRGLEEHVRRPAEPYVGCWCRVVYTSSSHSGLPQSAIKHETPESLR